MGPHEAINKIFPEVNAAEFFKKMRPIWLDLNLGRLTEKEAVKLYSSQLDRPELKLKELMREFKTSQTPIPGSIELLQELYKLGIPLYAITDNVREIMKYHYKSSSFLQYFRYIVVSAEIGVLKPNAGIYNHLPDKQNLNAAESVFIDDIAANVKGAREVGMQAFQFTDALSCRNKLIEMSFGIANK